LIEVDGKNVRSITFFFSLKEIEELALILISEQFTCIGAEDNLNSRHC
jgi:hypothetical protein